MGKKGSWFSAIKKVFTHSSKEKVTDGTEKTSSKEKWKKGLVKLKHGDGRPFIPFFRGPSSIEKILGEAEREQQIKNHRPSTPVEQPKAQPHVTTPPPPPSRAAPPKIAASLSTPTPLRVDSPPRDAASLTLPQRSPPPLPRVVSPPRIATPVNSAAPIKAPSPRFVQRRRKEPTLEEEHICATKIQAAYRGYMARKSYRALKGLVRLQAVVKGQSVKRQTANALKCMQLLVRVQTEIQSRRIQTFENHAKQRQAKDDKELESIFSKFNSDEWDDSTLTKEEIDGRMQRKVDAIVKRERAMAYATSHQASKSTPRVAQSALMNVRPGGFPFWWNWLEQRQAPPRTPVNPSQNLGTRSFLLTPTRANTNFRANSPVPCSSNFEQLGFGFDNLDPSTPRSSKSTIPLRTKMARTPPGRLQQKFTIGSASQSPFHGAAFRDDDSLTSCPPFSVPRYMSPTASAKAKVRGSKEHFPDNVSTTTDDSRRRASFPLGQDFNWNKGPLFTNKETSSQKVLGKTQSLKSVGNPSINSTVSMPATGRKAFNRFA